MKDLQVNQDLYQKLTLTEQALIDNQEKLEAQIQANKMLTKQIQELRIKQEKFKIENNDLKTKQQKLVQTVEDGNFKFGSLLTKYNTLSSLLVQSDAKSKQYEI